MEGSVAKTTASIVIPGEEVKNGQEIRAKLSPQTAGMMRLFIDRYRSVNCSKPTSWLFPRGDGSAWTPTQACTDLKDTVLRYIGMDVTPHLIRSLAGKIILDEHPGAVAMVQQMLGHKRLETTMRFYARLDPQKTRAIYQKLIAKRRT